MASPSRPSNNLPPTAQVSSVLSSLENLIEADSSAILGDLDLLAKLNNAAVDRYRSMTDAAKGLEVDSEYLQQRCRFIEPASCRKPRANLYDEMQTLSLRNTQNRWMI